MGIKVIITGATGMVGEGVLLECLAHPEVAQVLMLNRKAFALQHPKLKECLVADFMHLDEFTAQLTGYDACFFCAGISSVGMKEATYRHITYDITMNVARTLVSLNPTMVFDYISGALTDSSEKGRVMWARVKGKTENDLMKLAFKRVYNFRPGFMKPVAGQKNVKFLFKAVSSIYPLLHLLFPNQGCTLQEVALAMINSVRKGYSKQLLKIRDIRLLARDS